ncbi:MAG TPA: OmpH family outer membrane protein [Patescibacteria group bacterium]|nr:OmpH family outer membrane protein [Patescibacteria group bacterium]
MIIKSSTRRIVAGCLFVAALSLSQGAAVAQEAAAGAIASPVIAVVDVEQIMQESSAAKGARGQVEKFQQSFQEEMGAEENALRTKQGELDGLRKTLSQEAFTEKVKAFDASVAEFQRKGALRRRAIDRSIGQAMGQINEAMIESIRTVAGAHGANVVLPRTQVMMFDEKMNITKEIIDSLNKKIPHVEVPTPKVEADSAASKKKP